MSRPDCPALSMRRLRVKTKRDAYVCRTGPHESSLRRTKWNLTRSSATPGPPSMDLPGRDRALTCLRLQSEQDETPAEPLRSEENVAPETSRATLRYARSGFTVGDVVVVTGRAAALAKPRLLRRRAPVFPWLYGISALEACLATQAGSSRAPGHEALAVTVDVGDDAAVERAWDPTLQLGRCRTSSTTPVRRAIPRPRSMTI